MGRQNARGLELSFKPVKGGRGRGRWYKKIKGHAIYFGWGEGVTDRVGYRAALAAYRQWLADAEAARARPMVTGLTRRLQSDFSVEGKDPRYINLPAARERIARLRELGGSSVAVFERLADAEEKHRLIEAMDLLSLDEIRAAMGHSRGGPADAAKAVPRNTGKLLDDFLAVQRQRMELRKKLDKLREEGTAVREAAKQNISPGRFATIARDLAAMKRSVGTMAWDGTEATAAKIVRKFRDDSDALVLDSSHSPHSFNDRIKLARMFCAWAEATYQLDRLPRDRAIFAKYSVSQSKAKAIPKETLRTIWNASDDRGRCWLLLGLNCGYYAQDISDLTAEMIDGEYLNHTRGKTGVKVKYGLWATTRVYLKKFAKSGRVFSADTGKPLVHYATLKKSGEPVRVDNVRNWFYRLCQDHDVTGFSFSNVRDTATTEVEKIDRTMTDLFLAHRDNRMASLYIDGEMTDPAPLRRVTDELEKRLNVWMGRSN